MDVPGKNQKEPDYCLDGDQHRGGMNLRHAFVRNVGTLHVMVKENL